jgi:hypothetical protein
MSALATLAQALGIAFASGISLYSTVALIGIAERWGVVSDVPAPLDALQNPWIIGLAFTLTLIEFGATLVPGIASAWDAVHSLIRPPAAAALAVLAAWHGDATLVIAAGLLGGSLGLATHATKLGVRVAVDASPEPVTNGLANVAEFGAVALVVTFVWAHPFATLGAAIATLAGAMWVVRSVWRKVRAGFRATAGMRDQ